MPTMFRNWIVAAMAIGIAIAGTSVAQAHHAHWHHTAHWQHVASWPAALPYSYAYSPLYGFSRYGNCYLVEDFAPYSPHLIRVCPPR